MLLRALELTKVYGPVRALDRLSLEVAPGEVFGLLGPNGSGKSTALRLLLGFLRPSSGQAWVGGHDCWHDSVAARRLISYLPGELRLYENMSGRQLVRWLRDLRGAGYQEAEADRLARALDIDLARPVAQLSSGMKRKVALLQVLLPRAPLVVLDEPTNTLDPTMRDELLALLRQARDAGQAVLFSSHVLSEVEKVCDRVGILQQGRLVHVQGLRDLQQARLIRVRFPQPVADLPELPGLRCTERDGTALTLEYPGPLPPLLDWLARRQATDLTVAPLGLAPIYRRYHGGEA